MGRYGRYRGTRGTELKNFQRAQHFWPGTEVQRYTAQFLCCASDNFEKNFDFFDEVQRYARYMRYTAQNFSEEQHFWAGTGGTEVHEVQS